MVAFGLAVEPYILVDIYCRNLPLQNLAVLDKTKISNQMSTIGVYIHHRQWLGVCLYIILRGFSVLLIRFVGSQGLDVG